MGMVIMDIKITEGFTPPQEVVNYAHTIVHQNFTLNTPREFQKHVGDDALFKRHLSIWMECEPSEIDYVFFSCPNGATPHRDELNLSEFEKYTFLMPIILPEGKVILKVNESALDIQYLPLGVLIRFNHQHIHSLELENPGKCVMIMAAKLQSK